MTKTIDFDAFRQEKSKEPIALVIGGETYMLPGSLPAAVAIDVIRMRDRLDGSDGNSAVPIEELDTIGKSVFSEGTWRAILVKHQLTVDEMGELFKRTLEAYTGSASDPTTAG